MDKRPQAEMLSSPDAGAVTVIIPNYNGASYLRGCLDSLLAQRGVKLRVVVVDNGSTDESYQILETHPVNPLVVGCAANLGFAAAVNAGIRVSRTEVVALLNNDAVADPRWLATGLAALRMHQHADIVASLMLRMNERDVVDSAGDILGRDGRPQARGRGKRAAGFTSSSEVFSACAGAAFYRRRLFEEIGYFEESFFSYLEDLDLCFRGRLSGKTVIFSPQAVVYHYGAGTELSDAASASRYDSAQRVEWIARNRVWLWARNMPWPLLLRWLVFWFLGLCRAAGYHAFISGQARAFCRGLCAGLAGLPKVLQARKKIQATRKVSISELRKMILAAEREQR